MKRWSFAAQKKAPWARWTKRGVPPTALKARTGELTPPGITALARSNRGTLRSVFCVMGREAKAFEAGLVVFVVGCGIFGVFGLGPEHAVGHHMAHTGPETGVQAVVEVAQGLVTRFGQVAAAGQQGGQCGRQGVAGSGEGGIKQLKPA